jgi:predicted membrane protein
MAKKIKSNLCKISILVLLPAICELVFAFETQYASCLGVTFETRAENGTIQAVKNSNNADNYLIAASESANLSKNQGSSALNNSIPDINIDYIAINKDEIILEDEHIKYVTFNKAYYGGSSEKKYKVEIENSGPLYSSTDGVEFMNRFDIPLNGGGIWISTEDSDSKQIITRIDDKNKAQIVNASVLTYIKVHELKNTLRIYNVFRLLLIASGGLLLFGSGFLNKKYRWKSYITHLTGSISILASGLIPFFFLF